MLEDIDLCLLDVKSGDEETYHKVTGGTLQPTIDFGQRLAKAGKKIWVRFVLVPGLTDSEENVENVAKICESFGDAVEHIDVLVSLTNTITPDGLGRDEAERIGNLVGILDAGNGHGLYHANINVLRRETMEDAVEHPEKYPHLTVRVSGYAVNFVKLTKEQQLDVISRTFHQGAVVD